MSDDWSVVEARKLASVCRKNGLHCRVVRKRTAESCLHIYREGGGFSERLSRAQAEAREKSIDANWVIVAKRQGED